MVKIKVRHVSTVRFWTSLRVSNFNALWITNRFEAPQKIQTEKTISSSSRTMLCLYRQRNRHREWRKPSWNAMSLSLMRQLWRQMVSYSSLAYDCTFGRLYCWTLHPIWQYYWSLSSKVCFFFQVFTVQGDGTASSAGHPPELECLPARNVQIISIDLKQMVSFHFTSHGT